MENPQKHPFDPPPLVMENRPMTADPIELYMASVREAGSLREALVKAASLIGDQLDPGMQAEGLMDDWQVSTGTSPG